jgi:hypothetical protein
MTKEFIPYEQSLELKNLGFDEPCFGWYSNMEGNVLRQGYCETYLGIENCAKSPLYQQVFRWFREKFNLRSSVMDFIDDVTGIEWDYSIAIIGTDLDDKGDYVPLIDYSIDDPNRKYGTYEEAELECIKKLIEISKNK